MGAPWEPRTHVCRSRSNGGDTLVPTLPRSTLPIQPLAWPLLAHGMTSHKDILGGLLRGEEFWRDRYHWFKEQGYILRPRYHPEWVPSWKGTNDVPLKYEDGMSTMVCAEGLH